VDQYEQEVAERRETIEMLGRQREREERLRREHNVRATSLFV